jgi:hypothetical protein
MVLKIGDKIYIRHFSRLIGFQTIIRLTKTMAISKHYRFNRETWGTGGNYVPMKGMGIWNAYAGYVASPKLDAEWKKIKDENAKKLSTGNT